MKIYLSGITLDTDTNEIDRLKLILVSSGCNFIIPEEILIKQISWTENLRTRLGLLENCPAIYMLSDWKSSITARIELTAAMNDKMHLCFCPEDIRNLITSLDN